MERVEVELLRQSWNLIVPRSRTHQVVPRYGRNAVKLVEHLLPGQHTLRRRLILIGAAEDSRSRSRGLEDEWSFHEHSVSAMLLWE